MAAIAKLSSGVRPADIPERQYTVQLAETCAQGDAVRFDATNGTWTGANGTTIGEANTVTGGNVAAPHGSIGILLEGGIAGEWRTAVTKGKIAGFNVSGLNVGAPVYLSDTDKTIADSVGTITVMVGRVAPATANATLPYDKIIEVG